MKNRYTLIVLVIAGVTGCSGNRSPDNTTLSPELPPKVLVNDSQLTDMPSEITEPENLTLPRALALTLERSPELKSFSHTVRAGEARIIQAGLIPNPEISLQFEDMFGPYGGGSYSQATLQLSQVIELGGKRSARVDAASAFHDQLKDDYEVKRVEVLSSLTDKFIRTIADEQLFKLSEKGVELAQKGLENIRRRTQAGGSSELEEIKARVLLARSQIASEHAEHELLSSKKELVSFWGEETPRFLQITSDLFHKSALPSFEELASRIDRSPEIRKWMTEKRLREAEKKLADSRAVPNLTLSGGPRRLQTIDTESWVFGVSIPLTIFDRNQGTRKEAEILHEKVEVDKDAALLRMKTTLFGLYQEAKHAQVQLETMRQEVIPQAERAFKMALAGYDQGRFSYLDLLDAQRTLLDVSAENIEAAYSLHSYINAMERLLGAPLRVQGSI